MTCCFQFESRRVSSKAPNSPGLSGSLDGLYGLSSPIGCQTLQHSWTKPDVLSPCPVLPSTGMGQVFGCYQLSWKLWAGFILITEFQTCLKNKTELLPPPYLRDLGLTLLAFPPHIPFTTFPLFGPRPSNLLSKVSRPVMGHNPVQWVVG